MLTRDELEKKRRYPEGDDDAIDTAVELYDEVDRLKEQLERMKCCSNCKHMGVIVVCCKKYSDDARSNCIRAGHAGWEDRT